MFPQLAKFFSSWIQWQLFTCLNGFLRGTKSYFTHLSFGSSFKLKSLDGPLIKWILLVGIILLPKTSLCVWQTIASQLLDILRMLILSATLDCCTESNYLAHFGIKLFCFCSSKNSRTVSCAPPILVFVSKIMYLNLIQAKIYFIIFLNLLITLCWALRKIRIICQLLFKIEV